MGAWNLLIQAAAVLASVLPGSWASSQVFTAPDVPIMADMVVAGANPIDPELTPFWQLVHNQQEIFADCFHQPWSKYDTYLPLGGWAHADYASTTGARSFGEPFGLDVVLAATADLENDQSIDEQVRDQLAAMQFEWSWVAAYLSGPQAVIPIDGVHISMVADGEQFHFLLITERLDGNAMAELEGQQDSFHGRTLPSTLCVDANGNPVTTDPLYDTCMLTVQQGYARERSCLITNSGAGPGVAFGLTGACWTINTLGGGIASPVCWGVTGAALAYGACLTAQWPMLWEEKNSSEACCCTTLQCRNGGQPGCPDISTCDLPHSYCGNVPCAPLL
ncbi:MAG: hypothetical protein KJZ65_00005 [Phycisphaerales bacterium]|nr:hypothetical protein [Phycisphaerales bacterium]